MTVRGEGCMADTHNSSASGQSSATCNGHTDQRTGQRSAGAVRHTADNGAGSSREEGYDRDARLSDNGAKDQCLSKAAEADDELPLGSEANTLRQAQGDGVAARPPVDKRLWLLRQRVGGSGAGGGGGGGVVGVLGGVGGLGGGVGVTGGGGGGGGGQLQHSGWTSFNSDASNLTSCSNQSASSVEWLLQERQVDPEQILLNLGFGGSLPTTPTPMYNRIPDRFLQSDTADGPAPDDAVPEGGTPAEAAPGRNPSRGQYLQWLFGTACLSNEYCRYILSKIPDYYFKQVPRFAQHSSPPAQIQENEHPPLASPPRATITAAAGAADDDGVGVHHGVSWRTSIPEVCVSACAESEKTENSRNDSAAKSSLMSSSNNPANSGDSFVDGDVKLLNSCSVVSLENSVDESSAEDVTKVSKPGSDGSVKELESVSAAICHDRTKSCFLSETKDQVVCDSVDGSQIPDSYSPSVSTRDRTYVDGPPTDCNANTPLCADIIADSHPAETEVTLQMTNDDDDIMSSSVQTIDEDNISSSSESASGDELDFPNEVTDFSNTSPTS